MNEVTKEGYSAIEQALRDEVIPPRVEPKRFERRDTVALPTTTALTPEGRAEERRGFAHSRAPDLPPIDAIIAAHESSHGDFTGNATTAQALKYVMRQGKNWEEMPAWMRESLEQMQTKVARILAGDFNDPDHWKDLQGYPRLVETRLEK